MFLYFWTVVYLLVEFHATPCFSTSGPGRRPGNFGISHFNAFSKEKLVFYAPKYILFACGGLSRKHVFQCFEKNFLALPKKITHFFAALRAGINNSFSGYIPKKKHWFVGSFLHCWKQTRQSDDAKITQTQTSIETTINQAECFLNTVM